MDVATSRHPTGGRHDSAHGERALAEHYGIASLDGLGSFGRAELSAAGALIAYLELTQKGKHTRLMRVACQTPSPPASRFVFELKAQGQHEGEDQFHKGLAIAKELKVGGFILEIDGDRPGCAWVILWSDGRCR